MKHFLLKSMAMVVLVAMCGLLTYGQVSSTGSITGTVTDSAGAGIANATIAIKNNATSQELTAQTANNGTFTVPSLDSGTYTITIRQSGFKQSIVTDVAVQVGQPSTLNVALEVGGVTETVNVSGSGAELLNTSTANVASTITGRQITDLPYASRNALDVVLLLPGTQTVGRPRSSSVNGLPKSALNITLDGVNIQDNLLKGSDGFFTFIQPKTDAIEEVTLSTSTPGAESSGEGSVQIKFATRSGTNDFHGSLYEYHRDRSLNANFYYNNRDLPPDPRTGKAPRTQQLLNQPGGRIGGPIIIPKLFNGRDRAFFFINYEEYRLPEQQLRTRQILAPAAQSGVFTYTTSSGATNSVNLLTLAASKTLTSTIDPTVGGLLSAIRSSVTGGVSATSDPNIQNFTFINPGGQVRRFPTARFDFNLGKNNHLETIYNYQQFNSKVDFLNNVDPPFPGFPSGSQKSNRFSSSTTLRTTLSPSLVNEARFGLTGGTVLFFPEINTASFANQGGFNLNLNEAAGITNATASNFPQRRNTPVKQFSDSLNYVRGNHNFNFGGNISQINTFLLTPRGGIVPQVSFAEDVNDTAVESTFVAANFPGASSAQVTQAQNLYRLLVGRVSSISGTAFLNEAGTNYTFLGNSIERYRQREFGIFGQDTWRIRPNLTLTGGLRYELQNAPVSLNSALAQTTFEGLFGNSGVNGLFKPGATGGTPTLFTPLLKGQPLFKTSKNNFAPSIGVNYSPDFKGGLLGRAFGNTGQTVLRGGYSIAYNRDGLNLTSSIVGANPGISTDATRRSSTTGAINTFAPGSLLRNVNSIPAPVFPSSPTFPISPTPFDSANAFDPNLKTPRVESFTFGIQREITKNMVFEARYVGNRGKNLLRQVNLNEINTIENGFLNEFKLAQANLAANQAAGKGNTFAFTGVPGTSPLPIILAYFSGLPSTAAGNTASYTSANFTSNTFLTRLQPNLPQAQSFAGVLNNPLNPFIARAATAGLPANFFVVNPQVATGGTFLVENTAKSWYDGLTFELRRRLSAGLLVQASYTFSKSLTNAYASSSIAFSQPRTLRNQDLDKTFSPFDIRHALKFDYIYELPVGKGRRFLGNSGGLVDALLGGFSFNGNTRIQSGAPVLFGNIQLVGLTAKELQRLIKIRKTTDPVTGQGQVFYLPDDIILNTRRAFNTVVPGAATSGNPNAPLGYSALGVPTGRYIAPASSGGCIQGFAGQCGLANLVLHGPRFIKSDMSIAKKFRFTERVNLEMRVEFLNVFNNINFRLGSYNLDAPAIGNAALPTFGSSLFGQLNSPDTAYRDVSTTNDPGGRVGQLVIRFNF